MPQDLNAESVSFRYPKSSADALHEVSVGFAAGSSTAVMGAAEAGKSTLLQTLTGVIPNGDGGDLNGQIRYGLADLADYRVQTLTQYIGLVLQDPASQVIGRTVGEDVAFGPRNHLIPRAEIRRRIVDALEAVGLAGFENRATGELSGGELQRLAIAGVLAMGPEVLCLDEATSELDPDGARDVRRVVAALRRQGITVIAADHDPVAVLSRAEHVVVLDHGQLAWQGPPADLFADPDRAEKMGIRPLPMARLGRELLRARPEWALNLPVGGRLPITVPDMADWLRRVLALGGPSYSGDNGRRHADDALSARSVETGRTDSDCPHIVTVGQELAATACLVPLNDQMPCPDSPADGTGIRAGRPVIEIENLHFGYSAGDEVLHGIDLTIGAGEFVALIGANGAGKTTVAKHLNGLLRPASGSVRICGEDIADQPTWKLAGRVGYVFQNPDHQIFCKSVAEEVGYALRMAGRPDAEVARKTAEVLEFTGLSGVADENPLTLTRGQRQLVAMASILVVEPEILVIDEPTTGQDWRGVRSIMRLIDRLNQQGTTIVMISHDMELVAEHASRVIRIEDGRIVADGPAEMQVSTQLGELWRTLFGLDISPRLSVAVGRLLELCGKESSHEPHA